MKSRRTCLLPRILFAMGAFAWATGLAFAQVAGLPGFEVTRGSENPDAIPLVKAYEGMVRGHLIGDPDRGIEFLSYNVRLNRESARELFDYAREGWAQIVALQLEEAQSICDGREDIVSKSALAQRILSARENEDALRSTIFEGAFEILDERNGERLRRYVEKARADITTSSYDIERSITESADPLATMITRVCAHVRD